MTEVTLVKKIESIFNEKGYLTAKEISAGYGRADLIIGKLNPAHCKIRINNKQKKQLLNENYFEVLRLLPDIEDNVEPLELSTLSSEISFHSSNLKYKIIKFLEKAGYVKRVDGNNFFKINGWLPIASEIIAIEAKLSNWQRALVQANRYKSFADKVYVAIPESKLQSVKRENFRNLNIGLLVLTSENRIREIIKPKKTKIYKIDKRNFVSEYIWNYKRVNCAI